MTSLQQLIFAIDLLNEYHEALGRGEEPHFPQEAQDIVNSYKVKELYDSQKLSTL